MSGVVATDSNGDVVGPGDVRAQARQVFRNLALVVEAAGATPADVAKLNVDDRPLINPLRQGFFREHRPASTLVEVSRLVRADLLLEIEAVAVLPGDEA